MNKVGQSWPIVGNIPVRTEVNYNDNKSRLLFIGVEIYPDTSSHTLPAKIADISTSCFHDYKVGSQKYRF